MFKEYFLSVYTSSLPNQNATYNFPNLVSNIRNIHITLMDTFNELKNLNINLCPSPDIYLQNFSIIAVLYYHIQFTTYSNSHYPQKFFHLILK